jgi:serine/threonine protein kinase
MNRAERHDTTQNPQSFGRYRIRGMLGEGGMGRLYVAEQTGIEGFAKIVALKRILPHLADSAPFRTLFLNEARVAARLEHPNIVATYELGEVQGTYFMAMEYLPGEDLRAVLSRCEAPGRMPVEVAALLAQQSANGLHYAHELRDGQGRHSGLVHRDVNPSNIFVTYHGMVKLLDFGVVKASTATTKTTPGVFKGKYAYCAPEQIQGEPIDHRTDLFCLGIVLWECLTGQRLFAGGNDAQIIDAVRTQAILPPSQLRPEVPLELDEITLRALARQPGRRYQSAFEMSEALDRFLGAQRHRPTSNTVGQWLESLFGAERAALKKAIAQGSEVETALSKLSESDNGPPVDPAGSLRSASAVRPRPLWSTGLDSRMTAPKTHGSAPRVPITTIMPPSTPMGRVGDAARAAARAPGALRARLGISRGGAVIAFIGVAAVAAGAVVVLPNSRKTQTSGVISAGAATGSLEIHSEPPGAHILLDGDPSGLDTPATLRDLPAGRVVEIRLDKAGYAPVTRKIEVTRGAPSKHAFKLAEGTGTVTVEGMPAGAALYVDDAPTDPKRPFTVTVGTHKLRVEGADDVVFADTIEVRPGEQTVRIRADRRTR